MMDIYQLKGCGTALVTPFDADGARVDEAALRRLVRRQIDSGIDFLVPCGTTGESPVLSSKEHFRVVEIVLEEAKGKVPVIAGAGGNNTERVREGIAELESMGVDAILSVSPYYNKPSQEGLYQHYRALAESTRLPILVYNVPGRTGSNVEPKTLERLAAIPNILGVKEASGNIAQIDEILRLMHDKHGPERFRVISGDDALTLPMMALGAHGRHLRCLERRARRNLRHGRGGQCGRPRRRAPDSSPPAAAHAGALHRSQSHPGEVRAGRDGPDAARLSPAAGAALGGEPGQDQKSSGRA